VEACGVQKCGPSGGGALVFTKKATETLTAAHRAAAARLPHRWSKRWLQPKGAVWAGSIVVAGVLAHHVAEVPLSRDQQPVQALVARAPDPALCKRIGNRFQLHAIGTVVDDFASFTPTTR